MTNQIDLRLDLPDGLNGHEVRDDLRRRLRPRVGEIRPVDIGALPHDRRGTLDVLALALSTLASTAEVIGLVRDWLAERRRRGDGDVTVTIVIGADEITIIEPLTGVEKRAVDSFIRRHDGAGTDQRTTGGHDDHS